MHLALLVVFCLVVCGDATSFNAIIGWDGFVNTFNRLPARNDTEDVMIRTHLQYVHDKFSRVASPDLKYQTQRTKNLHLLQEYIDAAKFPVNTKILKERGFLQSAQRNGEVVTYSSSSSSSREPIFIDDFGTPCAVGYLIQETSEKTPDLSKMIDRMYHNSYLGDMNLPELDQWIVSSGFTAMELATIQPTYDGGGLYIAPSWPMEPDLCAEFPDVPFAIVRSEDLICEMDLQGIEFCVWFLDCQVGYQKVGGSWAYCHDGAWSGLLSCEPAVECPVFPSIPHVNSYSLEFECDRDFWGNERCSLDFYEMRCLYGYEPVEGIDSYGRSRTTQCENGVWSYLPSCIPPTKSLSSAPTAKPTVSTARPTIITNYPPVNDIPSISSPGAQDSLTDAEDSLTEGENSLAEAQDSLSGQESPPEEQSDTKAAPVPVPQPQTQPQVPQPQRESHNMLDYF